MNNITEALYRVNGKNNETEVHLGKVNVTPTSVQKVMSSGGGSETTEVMPHPWRLVCAEINY